MIDDASAPLSPAASFLPRPDGARLAYLASEGRGPGLVWLGGFKSDMRGQKAEMLHERAEREGRAFVRFDYRGHGESDGAFADFVVGDWLDDALTVLGGLTDGPQVLVGSSMGAWIALLAARARPDRVAGLTLVAPAPDFVTRLMAPQFSDEVWAALERQGFYDRPSEYDPEPYRITRALVEDGRKHAIMDAPIPFEGPVRILQGMADEDVPWSHPLDLMQCLTGEDVAASLVKADSLINHRRQAGEVVRVGQAMIAR
ncbi:MAG: alpha/beta hydrolase, partial [Pseudomonadota bacterium]